MQRGATGAIFRNGSFDVVAQWPLGCSQQGGLPPGVFLLDALCAHSRRQPGIVDAGLYRTSRALSPRAARCEPSSSRLGVHQPGVASGHVLV